MRICLSTEHNNVRTPVICPICIVLTTNDPNQMVSDLAQHMRIEHNTQASVLDHPLLQWLINEQSMLCVRVCGKWKAPTDQSASSYLTHTPLFALTPHTHTHTLALALSPTLFF